MDLALANAEGRFMPPRRYSGLGFCVETRIGAGSSWIIPLFLEPAVEMIEAASSV